ncbi:MAG: serine/threonine protein kinase [Planctomycetes bacterium]|nr:serine/threonine protein kinase [Planctomycetota bacterium]
MGELIPGFRITKQIGTGAGSKISLGTELVTGKTFAVKHVVRNSADDDKFIDQVEAEYAVSSKVEHPNLRRSFSIHRVRKFLQVKEVVVVMEYIDGLPLETARPNRLNTFLALFQKVAAGLEGLHSAGYVHADIKPTNIMLAAGGIVKIIDFGQACKMGHRKERIQGTPDYIAPEQVRRGKLDRRTDVFNLGATMYWVLTSENYPTAIRGADARGGISLISADKPLAPIELNDKIPLALSTLVMECCRDNPADRPSDMKQVAARLTVVGKLWKKTRENLRAQRQADRRPAADSTSGEPLADHAADSVGGGSVRFNNDTVRSLEEDE